MWYNTYSCMNKKKGTVVSDTLVFDLLCFYASSNICLLVQSNACWFVL